LEAGLAVAAGFKLGTYRGRDRKLIFRPLIEPALTRVSSRIRSVRLHQQLQLSSRARSTIFVAGPTASAFKARDQFRKSEPAEGRHKRGQSGSPRRRWQEVAALRDFDHVFQLTGAFAELRGRWFATPVAV
jgi:hypothetical protein